MVRNIIWGFSEGLKTNWSSGGQTFFWFYQHRKLHRWKHHMAAVMRRRRQAGGSAPTSLSLLSGSVSAPSPLPRALPPPLSSSEVEEAAPGNRCLTQRGSTRSSGSGDCGKQKKSGSFSVTDRWTLQMFLQLFYNILLLFLFLFLFRAEVLNTLIQSVFCQQNAISCWWHEWLLESDGSHRGNDRCCPQLQTSCRWCGSS